VGCILAPLCGWNRQPLFHCPGGISVLAHTLKRCSSQNRSLSATSMHKLPPHGLPISGVENHPNVHVRIAQAVMAISYSHTRRSGKTMKLSASSYRPRRRFAM
jgi:hypothetical protein